MSSQLTTLSTEQAAKYLGVSKSYLDGLRCYRPSESPPYAKIGARVVYPAIELERWLAARTVNAGKAKK